MIEIVTKQEKAAKKLPFVGVALRKKDDQTIELIMNKVDGEQVLIQLLEIVQSQATGKIYLNLLAINDNYNGEDMVLRRDNTGCIEHFNVEEDVYGRRKNISNRVPSKYK